MSKTNSTKFFKVARRFVSKHGPEILTGMGIVGMCTTVALAVKATPKALRLIEEAEHEKDENISGESRDLTPIEVVKVAWKPYIPAAVTGALSIGCIVGASSVSARRQAALLSAYKLSETAFAEYKDKVTETLSDKKVKEIKQKIAEDKVDEATSEESKTKVIMSSDGDTWFIDPISNIRFKSTVNKIHSAVNQVNRNINYDMYASLSEFYDELGIDQLDRAKVSDDIGWHIDDGLIETDLSEAVVRDGKAYVVLDFLVKPKYGFDDKSRLYG